MLKTFCMVGAVALLIGTGCQSAEGKALFATLDALQEQTGGCTCPGSGGLMLDGTPIAGGHSLILTCGLEDDQAVDQIYWVRSGVVYAVNEEARTLWPEMPVAPDTITAYDILLATDAQY